LQEHVVIVGGSSGMGRTLAAELVAQGSEVTITGRTPAYTPTADTGSPRD
jgi:NAD(P)-dependent dehydrogenase (short-subunit alcohol dehydrogenase family)